MAKLEIPTRAFLEDFFKRTLPDLDFSRGSALNDLLAKSMAISLLPVRHDIDSMKVGQSITNYPYMTTTDLDAIAANWGKFRQSGARSTGTVRIYFDTVADYQFNYLEFYAQDSTTFTLQSQVRITGAELMANRTGDNLYYADVAVISVGVGSRYSVPAGSIQGIRNAPSGIVRVENPADFTVTAPIETNADVVNSMFRNLGLRNLVNPQSIRAALFEAFPGIVDLTATGPQAVSMVRDLVTVRIGGADVTLHLGGFTDIWLNTTAVQTRTANFSYIPSSRLLRLVSAEQASAEELLYSFSQQLLTVDGEWSGYDSAAPALDESAVVVLEPNGIATSYSLAALETRKRYHLVATDRLSGTELIALPSPTGKSRYAADPVGFDMSKAGVTAGDVLRTGSEFRRVHARGGLVAELGPAAANGADVSSFTFDDHNGSTPAAAGARLIPFLGTFSLAPSLGDRVVIPNGSAAGHYRLLDYTAGVGLVVGNAVAQGALELLVDPDSATHYRWHLEDGVSAGVLPPIDLTTCWAHTFATATTDAGYDQTVGTWFKILRVVRTLAYVDIYLDGNPSDVDHVVIVQGLRGAIASGQPIFLERDGLAALSSNHLTAYSSTMTKYMSSLDAAFVGGSTTLSQPGLGWQAQPGDVLLFEGGPTVVPDLQAAKTGGDGSFFTLVVERALDEDTVEVVPPLEFDIPTGTRFALMRNPQPTAYSVTTTSATQQSQTVNVASVPLGLGDAVGLVLKATAGVRVPGTANTLLQCGISACASGTPYSTLTLTFAGGLSMADVKLGDSITVTGAPLAGTYVITALDRTAKTVQVHNTLTGGTFAPGAITATFSGQRFYAINNSSGGLIRTLKFNAPQQARVITFNATGYTPAQVADRGRPVTQTVGATTYYGTLFDYDNALRTWTIVPNDPLVDVFATTVVPAEAIKVTYGTGQGMPSSIPALVSVGYVAPTTPDDVGKFVRQGTYTGILLGVDAGYIWRVKPLSDADTFDQINVETFVDLTNSGESGATGVGTLREPGTSPQVNTGTTGLSLHRLPNFFTGDTVTVISRFPRTGLVFSNSAASTFPDNSVNPAVFSGLSTSYSLVVPFGANVGVGAVAPRATYAVTPAAVVSTDYVALPHGPGAVQLALLSALPAGSTTITVAGSKIGLWAMRGRALRLKVNSTVYLLAIDGNGGNVDAVLLLDPTPLPLYPGSNITVEVVEAYLSPYWLVQTTGLLSYRVFLPPDVAEPVGVASVGSQLGTGTADQFEDVLRGFSLMQGLDYSLGEAQLYLDSGPDASLVPKTIDAAVDANTVQTSTTFTATATGVDYHLGFRTNANTREEWFEAEIVSADELALRVPSGWSPLTYGTLHNLTVFVYAKDTGTDWFLSQLPIASYANGSLVLDLTYITDLARSQRTGVFQPATGFDLSVFGDKVWVMLRSIDRTLSRTVAGRASNTFNYYAGSFMSLPVVKILTVQQLSAETLEPVKDLPYTLVVDSAGLRYSAQEQITLQINDAQAEGQPCRVTYLSDGVIYSVNQFVNAPDTRVVNGNALVKRMETVSVDLDVTVQSTLAAADITTILSAFINTLGSSQKLSKDLIIRHLYEQGAVSFVDTATMRLSGAYYAYDGTVYTSSDVAELFGSSTACYLSSRIVVSKLST